MEKIRLRGKVLNKKDILNNPDKYKDMDILCINVPSPGVLRAYLSAANMDHQTVTLENWGKEPGDRQRGLFFALVERFSEHWFPGRKIGRKEKDETYRMLVSSMDITNEYGVTVDSISDMDSIELSGTIDMIKDELRLAGVDISYLEGK